MGQDHVTRPRTASQCVVKSLDSIGKRVEQPKTDSGGIDESQAVSRDPLRSQAKVGTVCRIKDFGGFAMLANEPVKGLVTPEMSHEHVESTSQAVTVGEAST